MIFCIDSQIIIWGIKNQSTDTQVDMIEKAATFFNWVDYNGHEIVIPTVVVAEILAPEPIDVRIKYSEILNKNFRVVNFDNLCALKYAQILNGKFEDVKKIGQENDWSRQKMKLDHLIIASAIANNATCIYSYDKGLKSFANNLIDVKEFPPAPTRQPDLFSQQ